MTRAPAAPATGLTATDPGRAAAATSAAQTGPTQTGPAHNIARTALRKGGGIMAFVFVLSFVVNLLRLTGPVFMILIYDRVMPSRSQETLIVLFAMMITLLVVMGLMDYARRRLLARFGAQFQERIEGEMFSTTSKAKFFARGTKKPVVGLDELDGLRGFIHSGSLLAVLDFVWTPMFLAVVFVLHWKLGLIALAGIALMVALSAARQITTRAREDHARRAAHEITTLKDMMTTSRGALRNHEITGAFNRRWLGARQTSRDSAIERSDMVGWFQVATRQSRMMLQYSVLAMGAYLTLKGELTIGAMVAAMFLVVRVIVPVEQMLNHLPSCIKALRNWKTIKAQMAERHEIFHAEDAARMSPRLEMTSLTTRSPVTKANILRGVNMIVPAGSVVEVSGDSGAGKSVLAETLLGVWPRSGGTLLCGGANLDRFSSQQAAQIFGYVPQREEFFDGTIADNITGMDAAPDTERLYDAARLAFVHEAILGLPDGYQTMLYAGAVPLSKGQQSRIAFARAIYRRPRILVIDEPDSWLRASLPRRLAPMVADIKARGDILIVLSRKPLNLAETTLHFHMEEGRLKTLTPSGNVTKLADKKAEKTRRASGQATGG